MSGMLIADANQINRFNVDATPILQELIKFNDLITEQSGSLGI